MNNFADYIYKNIREKIAKGDFASDLKLPSTRKLANLYHASRPTIQSAINKLEKEGLIEKKMRSGTYIKGMKEKSIEISFAPDQNLAQKIAEEITRDILRGGTKTGDFLPLQKMLKYQYKTSNTTIKTALDIVRKKGLIQDKGNGYMVSGANFNRAFAKNKVYIIDTEVPFHRQFYNIRTRQFLKPFEDELQKYGITTFEYLDLFKNPELLSGIDDATTAGFLLDIGSAIGNIPKTPVEILSVINKIFEGIKKRGLPLVIDNYPNMIRRYPDFSFKVPGNIFPLWTNNKKAGEKAGKYLASVGHKNIAYFFYLKSPNDKERLAGLEESLKMIFPQEADIISFNHDFDLKSEREKYDPYTNLMINKREAFRKSCSILFNGYNFSLDPVEEEYISLGNFFIKDHAKMTMTPYFEKALKLKNITAWVCSEAPLSMVASEFLKEKKIEVPQQLSLMAIGNDERLMGYGITTVEDPRSRAGYLAAHCIIGDLPIQKNKQGFVEFEGNIIVRKSVKRV
jgi:DNA-binding GntR family transcriptional regulator/DNA-binding LacI/PurR family transcriptional regulator